MLYRLLTIAAFATCTAPWTCVKAADLSPVAISRVSPHEQLPANFIAVPNRRRSSVSLQQGNGLTHFLKPGSIRRALSATALNATSPETYRSQLRSRLQPRPPVPGTIEQLIIAANGNEQGYASEYGTGVPIGKQTFPDLSAFNFNAAQLLAGNVVQGRSSLIEAGQISLYPLERAGGTLQIDTATLKPGVPVAKHIGQATKDQLEQARNDLANAALVPNQSGQTSCEYQSVTSSADASYKAGLSFGYLSAVKVNNVFSSVDSSKSSHVLIVCQQAFFTLSFTPDASADGIVGLASFFSPNLTVDSAKQYVTPDNTPLFISEVTYGAQLYMIVNSDLTTKEMTDDLSLAVSYAGVSGNGSLDAKTKSELDQMDVHVLSIGGRASAQDGVDKAFSGGSTADALVQWLRETQDFSASDSVYNETAAPLSYQLNYLDFVPVAETASINGDPAVGGNGIFQQAVIYFHSNGDGKNANTVLDLTLFDPSGRQIGNTHIVGAAFANNEDTSPIIIKPTSPGLTRSALNEGSFDVLIHTVGDDTWNFTAYIALCFADPNTGMNTATDHCPVTKGTASETDYRYTDRVSNHRSTRNVADPSNGSHTVESKVQFSAVATPPAP